MTQLVHMSFVVLKYFSLLRVYISIEVKVAIMDGHCPPMFRIWAGMPAHIFDLNIWAQLNSKIYFYVLNYTLLPEVTWLNAISYY